MKYIVDVTEERTLWYKENPIGPKILHREGGPAVQYSNGTKKWVIDGKLHREDGPAIEWFDGTKEWYFYGDSFYSEEVYLKKINSCDGKVVEIDGKKYKLVSL